MTVRFLTVEVSATCTMVTSSFCSATLDTPAWEHVVLATHGCDTGDTRFDLMMRKADLFYDAGDVHTRRLGKMWEWPLMDVTEETQDTRCDLMMRKADPFHDAGCQLLSQCWGPT